MRGRLEYVNKKMKIIRSRSADRLRGYVRPEVQSIDTCPVRQERPTRATHRRHVSEYTCDYTGPVLGQARALVSCVPSPYDTDVLSFQVRFILALI